jgi:hypothetical protein
VRTKPTSDGPHLNVPCVWLTCALLFLPCIALGDEATVAVVDFDLIDTSLQADFGGPLKADVKRLEKTEEQLRQLVDQSRFFEVIGDETAERLSRELGQSHQLLHECNSCEMRIGEVVGSDYVLVGWVQKVSNLILNMNLVLRKVPGGEDIVGASVDMRGNTDEAWFRAAEYIVERELLPEYAEVQKVSMLKKQP